MMRFENVVYIEFKDNQSNVLSVGIFDPQPFAMEEANALTLCVTKAQKDAVHVRYAERTREALNSEIGSKLIDLREEHAKEVYAVPLSAFKMPTIRVKKPVS